MAETCSTCQDEIPADIMRAAHLLLNEIAMCAPEDFAGRRALVESAILAERQRCAKVAEEYADPKEFGHTKTGIWQGWLTPGARIADAILKGEPG